ncbi:hypothetical protein IGI04_038570 [Brassica rapa subsp. trilocularis]|uniref:RING-type domain-containing protein n=1 Tax=Brassica rapa subsp. trilocularis TaxID=1813537 RepID=A0ABQ7LN98_BRACM|nr:hypothetical protein IGI04_038570 [Brassica rapa subsp. trilocularis]
MERETHNGNGQHTIDIPNDEDFPSSLSTDEETSDSRESNMGGATAHHELHPPLTSDEGSSSCTIGWNSMEFVFTSVQIVAALVVWTLSKDEHPRAQLLAWLIVHTCGCITGTLLLSWRMCNQVEEYPKTRVDRVMEGVKTGLECFFVLWLIWGISWISFDKSSPSDAPNLYRLCITFVALSCIRFSVALLRLCTDSEGEGQEGGFEFQGQINDDSCCICLEKFGEKKRAIRKLECSHMFHLEFNQRAIYQGALAALNFQGENGVYTKHTYTDSDLIALKALEKENPVPSEQSVEPLCSADIIADTDNILTELLVCLLTTWRNMHLKRMQEWNLLLEIIPYQQGMITFFTFKL